MTAAHDRDAEIRRRLANLSPMTPEQRAAQRESFARGNGTLDNALADLEREPDAFEDATEDQYTISAWATATFGPVGSNLSVAVRANQEMAELMRALAIADTHPKAAEEVADIVIILYRLADRLGVDLHAEIDRKMAINRGRTWLLDGNGHGQHVDTTEETP